MAAGLGFKNFASGEVLTAADVNAYLNSQTVMVFADAAARTAAITSPQEGMFSYLKDTNATQYYTGSAWTNLDTTGMVNPMTTTGDTIYSSSGTTPARLPIGSTGNILTVSGGVPVWAAPAAATSGLTLVTRQSFSGVATTSTTFDDCFTSTYKSYIIAVEAVESSTANTMLYFQYRYAGPTTQAATYYGAMTNYDHNAVTTNTAQSNANQLSVITIGSSSNATNGQVINFYVTGVGPSSAKPSITSLGSGNIKTGPSILGATQDTARAYTGFILSAAAGNITGTVAVYGLATA